jgi:hypothetical protein
MCTSSSTSKALRVEKSQRFQGERARISVSFPAPNTEKRHSLSGVFFARDFVVGIEKRVFADCAKTWRSDEINTIKEVDPPE